MDGAEINAALKNSESLIAASCQLSTDVETVRARLVTETNQIDVNIASLLQTVIDETNEIDEILACRKSINQTMPVFDSAYFNLHAYLPTKLLRSCSEPFLIWIWL